MELTEEQKKLFKDVGRQGGNKTKERYGSEHYRKIGKISAEKRKKLSNPDQ